MSSFFPRLEGFSHSEMRERYTYILDFIFIVSGLFFLPLSP